MNESNIKNFEEAVEALILKHAKTVTRDEMIGTFELLIGSLQEALSNEGAEV